MAVVYPSPQGPYGGKGPACKAGVFGPVVDVNGGAPTAPRAAVNKLKMRQRSSSCSVFRAQATCTTVDGSRQACIVKVDAEKACVQVVVPGLLRTVLLHLTAENFTVDLMPGEANGLVLRMFDAADEEQSAYGFVFKDSYCVTRVAFTLYVMRSDASLRGLCFLASACVRGSTKLASASPRFCPAFFQLHASELESFFPGRLALLLAALT